MKAVDIGDGGESCQLRLSSVFGTRDFPGIPAKYPGILPIWLIGWGPNQPQTRLRARENGWFPRKLERGNEREGAADRETRKRNEAARGNIRTA